MQRAAREIVRLALDEDLAGYGDVTSLWTVPEDAHLVADLVAREDLIVSGLPLAALVLAEVDPRAGFSSRLADGDAAAGGDIVATVHGRARSVLAAERTMLNFLTHLCGVATQSRRFSRAVEGTTAVVVDTRKTSPGLRWWEKRAVRHGGCENHRFGLFDQVLIKDNHVVAAGGVGEAVARAKREAPRGMRVEVEVETEAELRAALSAGADIVMLDNMTPVELAASVRLARAERPDVVLEASGGISLEAVPEIARTGVDLISTSALTSGASPVDLGLDARHDSS